MHGGRTAKVSAVDGESPTGTGPGTNVVDTTEPSVRTGFEPLTSHSGKLATDFITSNGAVTLSVAAADNAGGSGIWKVEFFDGATLVGTATTVDGAGNYSVSTTLASGTHAGLTAKDYDVAGNSPTATALGTIVVDTTDPSISTSSETLTSDTGNLATDFNTCPTRRSPDLAAADNAGGSGIWKVEFFDGATLVGTSTAVDGSGNYSVST